MITIYKYIVLHMDYHSHYNFISHEQSEIETILHEKARDREHPSNFYELRLFSCEISEFNFSLTFALCKIAQLAISPF